jgi:hypothetical protein
MKNLLKLLCVLIFFIVSCKKESTTIPTTTTTTTDTTATIVVNPVNPYLIYEGMYIGIYDPFFPDTSYVDTLYLEALNIDSFIVRDLDLNPIKLEINSSGIYLLSCTWTHCGRGIEIIPSDTLKYNYGYSTGTPQGSYYSQESFLGIKQ